MVNIFLEHIRKRSKRKPVAFKAHRLLYHSKLGSRVIMK
jgi:hypothetical protein